ncbi:hypothetical protein, partial [Enterococcus faecalis]|uniref:hypothetical protein n=1 Tax=Enterococcus faecalis TaxID=1351 RepID=UPI00403F79A7
PVWKEPGDSPWFAIARTFAFEERLRAMMPRRLSHIAPLVLVPFAARIGPLVWTLWLPPLHQGLAARFRSAIGPVDLAVWAAALLAAAWPYPALLATPVLVLCWGWQVR